MAGVPWEVVLLVGVVVAVGALLQSMVGIGLGVVSAPVLALVEPSLVPVLVLLLATPVSGVASLVEWRHISWRTVGWAMPARLPGIALGAWVVTVLDDRALGIVVSVMVLLAVALSHRSPRAHHSPATLVVAGFAAGAGGTATAIGGPPMAIVMGARPPREARATLSFFFSVGSLLSFLWLWAVGEVPRAALVLAALYLPVVALALLAGLRVRDRVPRDAFRTLVLGICVVAALVLLVRSVVATVAA